MSWVTAPFKFLFMRQALLASIKIGIICSAFGVFVVLCRLAFPGDTIAHTTLPGLVIACLIRWNLFVVALITVFVTVLGIGWIRRRDRLQEDTATGVVHSGMCALGVVLIRSTGSYRDFTQMLFGYVSGVSRTDLITIAVGIAFSLAVIGILPESFGKTASVHSSRFKGLPWPLIRSVLILMVGIVSAIRLF